MHTRSLLTFLPFFVAFAAIQALLHVYFYRRLVKDMTESRRARLMGRFGLFGLAVGLLAGPLVARSHPAGALLAITKASYVGWALAFYLFVCLLAADALRLLVRAARSDAPLDGKRRAFLVRTASFGASASAIGVTGLGMEQAYSPPEISEVQVRLPQLPSALSGATLVQLSDIHVGAWVDGRFVADLVERANALRPDAVLITGDLVDGSVPQLAAMVAPLRSLRSRWGTFFVTGNHEYYSGADPWCGALRSMGMRVLRNVCVPLGDAGASIDLVGVDDWSAVQHGFSQGYDLKAAVRGRDPTRAAVLLAHQPRGIEGAAALGIGLQLSGHTHGGQIWPWSFAVRAAFPYFSGRYQLGAMTVYVSRGCGFWGPPVRVRAPPEIVRIVLG